MGLAACAPAVVGAYKNWKEAKHDAAVKRAEQALAQGADFIPWQEELVPEMEEEGASEAENEKVEQDFADLRRLALQAEVGPRPAEFNNQLLSIVARENERWNKPASQDNFVRALGDANAVGPAAAGTRPWLSLGPGTARSSYNGTYYKSIDSGRPTQIRVKPGDPKTVYLATSGGGLWKATDFGQYPTWLPLTDNLGSLAIGALDIDPNNPATVFIGLGDAFDRQGGGIVKSTDEGATWGAPIVLAATHPVDGKPTATNNVRDIKVDPTNSSNILVATDDGFYRSTDGGATFGLIDLPNTAATGPVREATWALTYLGTTGGQSQWLVSGVYACPGGLPPTPASGTQNSSLGVAACASNPAVGNYGDFWKSTDSGATWVSVRASGALTAALTAGGAGEVGRMQIAGNAAPNPGNAVVYAQASTIIDSGSAGNATAAILKSTDGGASWTVVGTKATAMANPTSGADCKTLDIGHNQSYYNLAIAVDPGNSNNVLIGGNLCGARTRNGGATWENVAHWLPQGGGGLTADGFLPYVHADWHTATIIRTSAGAVAFAGTDGGLFASYNLFDVTSPATVAWQFPDVGLVTQLPYAVGSGDPVYGTGSVVFTGLQDNGTRFRLVDDESFVFDFDLQNWDQIIGGDGIGNAVANDSRGQNPVYWASVQSSWRFCVPRLRDCSRPTRLENGVEKSNWRAFTTSFPAGDGIPFLVRYGALNDDNGSVVANSSLNVYRIRVDPLNETPVFTRMTPAGFTVAGSVRGTRGNGPIVSPYSYTVDGVPARIYGVPLSSGGSAIIIDKGNAVNVINAATAVTVGTDQIGFIQAVTVPRNPASLGGTDVKQTWLVASAGAVTLANTVVPDSVGHLYKTTDAGQTWVPFHGNGTGFDLPNVPIWSVKYDPSDLTDSTIYVATEIGLYRTVDGGKTWARYGQGLPMVRTYDVVISSNGGLVRVATYGRGIWEIHPESEPASAPSTGDWDGNGVIDYFDLQAMATRLGTTPATGPSAGLAFSNSLFYSNTLDLTGSPTTIEEADLSALVAKFGSTP
ncbi:hypothetical protein FGE12_02405 [Aggregicoccus sp. 17bor-14]|uniref:WD40/YVTN/BNR-like repeat-containing protein n=1 Tax=Myxococcaceae TaxID=31 RepID=UPI00129D05A3|nr:MULTISPECIES: hypothetical protein [Myxococcaceae]MBF5041222.1 hypothetical protein [Simulacricoccus sp. 17bor-14]MRI87009.1 hypothetical protein [Aggregicoccus sp. 17bor-14]